MTPEDCVTCGDVAVRATVVEVRGDTAVVEVEGQRVEVGVELVAPVEAGDVLLCHAGIALARLDASPPPWVGGPSKPITTKAVTDVRPDGADCAPTDPQGAR